MNVVVRSPVMTTENFLSWVHYQEGRFELDAGRPIAMTGGTLRHNAIALNIYSGLRASLKGSTYRICALDIGLATGSASVRCPDVMIGAGGGKGGDLLLDDVIIAVEVISPTSARTDRVSKLREYLAVPSISRYVIAEQTAAALTVFERDESGAAWRATALGAGETLDLPEVGVSLPVADIYDGVDLPDEPATA